jgi:hypothetical protein
MRGQNDEVWPTNSFPYSHSMVPGGFEVTS